MTAGMAISASWQDVSPRASRTRQARGRRAAFFAARRHSRLVRILRLLLPVGAVAAVASMFVLTEISLPGDIDLTSGRLSVTRNAIIMDSPRITGFDKGGRQFFLNADRAVQALTNPDQVRLEAIEAKVIAEGHGATTITAESGDYDHGGSTLGLRGDIVLNSEEGYTVRMRDADVDLKAGTLTSPNAVSVGYQGSEITGARFSVSQGGKVLTFDGGVRTNLMPPKRSGPSATATPPE
jgi:lipopolysaccharide export system protein LptC